MFKIRFLKFHVMLGYSESHSGKFLTAIRNFLRYSILFSTSVVFTFIVVVGIGTQVPAASEVSVNLERVVNMVEGLKGEPLISENSIPVEKFSAKICALNNELDSLCQRITDDSKSYRVVLECLDCFSGRPLTQRLVTINEMGVIFNAGPYVGSGMLITAAKSGPDKVELDQSDISKIRSYLDVPMEYLPSAETPGFVWTRRLMGPIQYFTYFLFFLCIQKLALNYLSTVSPNKALRAMREYKVVNAAGKKITRPTPWTDNQMSTPDLLLSVYEGIEKMAIKASSFLGAHAVFPLTDFRKTALLAFKSAATGSEVPSFVSVEADAHRERLEASTKLIEYLIWAIPTVGFIGTVVGIGDALLATVKIDSGVLITQMIASSQVGSLIGVAFDTTLVALLLSFVLMMLFYFLQASHENMLAFEKRDTLQAVLRIENIRSE